MTYKYYEITEKELLENFGIVLDYEIIPSFYIIDIHGFDKFNIKGCIKVNYKLVPEAKLTRSSDNIESQLEETALRTTKNIYRTIAEDSVKNPLPFFKKIFKKQKCLINIKRINDLVNRNVHFKKIDFPLTFDHEILKINQKVYFLLFKEGNFKLFSHIVKDLDYDFDTYKVLYYLETGESIKGSLIKEVRNKGFVYCSDYCMLFLDENKALNEYNSHINKRIQDFLDKNPILTKIPEA